MKTPFYSLVVIGSLIAFAGCSERTDRADQIQENAEQKSQALMDRADQQAEAIEESAEQRAATLEQKAEGVKDAASDRVDSVQASAEKRADAIEESAEKKAEYVEKKSEAKSDSKLKGRGDHADVRDAQRKLKELGYLDGEVDGIYGNNTASAIRDFQEAQGMEATGRLDSGTLDQLHSTEMKAE